MADNSTTQMQNPLGSLSFQRNYLWNVLLPDMGDVGSMDVGQLIQSVQFGDYSIDNPSTIRVGAFQASFAGLLTVDRVQMTFLKTNPDIVSSYFNAWKLLIVGDDGLFFPKNNYQSNIYIRFVDITGIAFAQYKFIGAFPTKFPKYVDLSYAQSTVTTINIEFSVDKISFETLT